MNLRPYQQKLISDIFQYWKAGRKRVLLQSGTGTGKCLVKGTRVRMYSGVSMPVEDVQVGDLLMGDDGQPRRVLSLATGEEMCYDIIPVIGEKWGCNESHILSLKFIDSYGKPLEKCNVYDICLRDYLILSKRHKEKWIARARARYAVKTGVLKKPNECEVCGLVKPLSGHHEDYSKPLAVIWLCFSCHADADKKRESRIISSLV